jgi:mannose-1-phosphate guanylyltransferase
LEPSVLDRIDPTRPVSIERETFPSMVEDGSLYAMPDGGVYWVDAGTPETYLKAQLDLLDGRRALPQGVTLDAIHPSAVVARSATVTSSVLGCDVRVDDDAEIVGSVIQSGAVVGAKARVHGSIVGAGASIGDGATLDGLCVIGEGEVVAAGADLQGARVPAADE